MIVRAAVTPPPDWPAEQADLWRWRYHWAREGGMSRVDARELAALPIDAADIRRLVEKGCPPHLFLKLLA